MSKNGSKIFCLLIALSLTNICFPKVQAQTQNTGAIQGRVFDAGTLDPLPSVTVTVTHEEIGIERTTISNEQGIYYVGILPAGRYRITAQKQGYENDADPRNSIINSFLIHITNTERADQPPPIVLRKTSATTPTPPPVVTPPPPRTTPSQVPENEVSVLVNSSNASRGGYSTDRDLLSLPLPGIRTFDDLAFLVTGVAPPPQHIGTTVGPGIGPGVGTAGKFSVNGLRSRSNNFTIDGSDNNDEEVGVRRQGFTSLVPQSIESVQEFQITTLLPEPQFGRNMGAQVNAVSRSGGSGYHGTLYGFFTDKRLMATDPFDYTGGPANFPITRSVANGSLPDFADGAAVLFNGRPLAPANPVDGENAYTRGQYGFVFGGPVVKGKTFFFTSFEHQDINASKESHFAVPTIAQRGLFKSGDIGLQTDERQPRPVFPTSVSGDSFFSLFPFPNNPIGPYGPNTFTEVLPASADGSIFSIKLDHNLNAFGKSHSLAARYNFTNDNTILPVTGEALFSSLRALVRTQDFALSLNTPLSSRAANQFRFSFGRTRLAFREVRDPFLIPSTEFPDTPFLLNARLVENVTLPNGSPLLNTRTNDTETAFGITDEGIDSGTGPLGQMVVSGFSPLGVDVFNFPQGRANNLFQYADTLIYNLGRHRLAMGADIRRSQLNSFQERNFRPLATFSAAPDASRNLLTDALSSLGSVVGFYLGKDFLAVGAPTGFFQTLARVPDSTIGLRYWQNNFFFADQIRVNENFTLTLGMRYELNTVPREVNRRIESTFSSPEVEEFESLERSFGGSGVSGLEQFLGGRSGIYPPDHNNFAPHVAFAWDPSGKGKTSIRGGYGIYYDQILGSVISQSRNVFPSFLTVNLAGGETNPLTDHQLSSFNPSRLAARGTLNTLTPGASSNVVDFIVDLELATNTVTAPGFVLPAADLVTPYSQHWSLTIEQAIKKDFLISIGYVGTRGVHLLRVATPNLGPNAIPVVNEIVANDNGIPRFNGFVLPPNTAFAPRPGIESSLRPFPLLGSFTSIESDANSIYHSLQIQANKRFSSGFQFTTAYTWSHAIDEVSDIFDLAGARALPQDSFNRRAERGDANFDVRHRFVYSLIWDLPTKFLGGWQVASIGTFQTGQPYSVLFCCDLNLDGNLTERVGPGATSPGSTGRNAYRARGIETVDVAVTKRFRFGERQSLEFRSEFFNVFNRNNFGIPIHQVFFGNLTTEPADRDNNLFVDTRVPKRTIQFALKYSF